MITFNSVTKSFDGRPALVDANLSIPAGGRTAVVGVNGSGKSTLLRLAAGLLSPDSGTVSVVQGATLAHVPQNYALDAELTVAEDLQARAGVLQVARELRRLEWALAEEDPAAPDAYAAALERHAALGGYELEGRTDRVLAELGLPAGAGGRPR